MKLIGCASRRLVVLSAILLAATVMAGLVPWQLVAAEPRPTNEKSLPSTNVDRQPAVAQPSVEQQRSVAAEPERLVQIESKKTDNAILYMKATELERGAKTSKVKVVCQIKPGHVAALAQGMFVARALYDIAKARKCEYFVNLKEWDDTDGNRIYIVGFTNNKDADIKREFGQQYDYNDEAGQKRESLSVLQFAVLFEEPLASGVDAAALPAISFAEMMKAHDSQMRKPPPPPKSNAK